MTTYTYKCLECGDVHDLRLSMGTYSRMQEADIAPPCMSQGCAGVMRRHIDLARPVIFKGGGWPDKTGGGE